jgi:hypothetical protein
MTTATMDVDQLYADAAAKAAANPPGRVLATVVLAVFFALGWVLGRTWTALWFIGGAVRMGLARGNTIPRPEPQAAPAGASPGY